MKKFSLVLAILLIFSVFAGCSSSKYAVGVQSGTTGQYYVDGDEDWGYEGFANLELKKYNNAGLATQDMLNGKVNAVVVDEGPAKAIAKAMNGKVKVIDIKLTDEEYAFGVDKANPVLEQKVNEFIAKATADGTIEAIMDKYFKGDINSVEGIESAKLDTSRPDEQLVVATNAAFSPFEFTVGDKYAGVDIEIAAALAEYLGMELVIMNMDFEAVVTSVGKNGVDIAMAGLTVNETRKESVNFSTSYYNASQMVIVKADDKTFDDCKTVEDVEAILKSK